MRTVGATGYAILGAALTAIAFGLARYAFGLFVPSIRADLGLGSDIIGIVSSLPFVSFVGTSLLASVVANRLGARKAAMVASGIGFGGLALISQAGHLSGQLLVTGVRLLPRRPSLGPVLPFVSITVGQAVGSPVAGWAIERHDYVEAFGAFAVLAGLAAGSARLYPLPARVIMAQRVADSPAQA